MDEPTFDQHEEDRGVDRDLEDEHHTPEERCSSCDATSTDPSCFCSTGAGQGDDLCPHCEGEFICPAFPEGGAF